MEKAVITFGSLCSQINTIIYELQQKKTKWSRISYLKDTNFGISYLRDLELIKEKKTFLEMNYNICLNLYYI